MLSGPLRRMKSYVQYYHETRTHLSLEKDTPASRCKRRTLGRWSRCRKLVVFITGTNVGQRDYRPAGCVPRTVTVEPQYHPLAGGLPVCPSIRHSGQNQLSDQWPAALRLRNSLGRSPELGLHRISEKDYRPDGRGRKGSK